MKSGIFIILFLPYLFPTFAQNEAYIEQAGGSITKTEIKQIGVNIIKGIAELPDAASQITSIGTNILITKQDNVLGLNQIELFQIASMGNYADIQQQNGSHTIKLSQITESGLNEAYTFQVNGSGFINLEMSSLMNNIIPGRENSEINSDNPGIYQDGHNYLVGAFPTGDNESPSLYDINKPAIQYSSIGSNWLEVQQRGNDNYTGLDQRSFLGNKALINQENGNNVLSVIQFSLSGKNYLYVDQKGNCSASIYQNSVSGDNQAIIIQN